MLLLEFDKQLHENKPNQMIGKGESSISKRFRSITSRVWWIDKIKHDNFSIFRESPLYHSSRGYVMVSGKSIHMHSSHVVL